MPLNEVQIERYSRQIILPEVGGIGQSKLLASHVRLAGDRDAATWAALYLAAAGIGRLSGCAAEDLPLLARLNPDCQATAETLPGADVALLCNAVGDGPVECPTVVVHADGRFGSVTTLESGAQRRSGFAPDPERRCAPHSRSVVALLAVTEVLKLLLGVGRPLRGRRLACDVVAATVREEPLERVDPR